MFFLYVIALNTAFWGSAMGSSRPCLTSKTVHAIDSQKAGIDGTKKG